MKAELKILEEQLREILGDEKVKRTINDSFGDFRNVKDVRYTSLVAQIKELAQKETVDKDVGDTITYELYCKPTKQSSAEAAEIISSLDNKIAALESKLGDTNMMPYDNVSGALSEIQQRLATFDRSKIEAINKRVTTLLQDVDSVLKKKQQLDGGSSSRDGKINELYEMCHRWESSATALPAILKRLRALKVIHEQSGSFASRLTVLEKEQLELQKILETSNSALKEVKASLGSNMKIMQQNMETLYAKIAAS